MASTDKTESRRESVRSFDWARMTTAAVLFMGCGLLLYRGFCSLVELRQSGSDSIRTVLVVTGIPWLVGIAMACFGFGVARHAPKFVRGSPRPGGAASRRMRWLVATPIVSALVLTYSVLSFVSRFEVKVPDEFDPWGILTACLAILGVGVFLGIVVAAIRMYLTRNRAGRAR